MAILAEKPSDPRALAYKSRNHLPKSTDFPYTTAYGSGPYLSRISLLMRWPPTDRTVDAEAFDEAMAFRNGVREREMEVYGNLLEGYADIQAGRTSPASDAFARIRQAKGWA